MKIMINQAIQQQVHAFATLERICARGGPDPSEYEDFTVAMGEVAHEFLGDAVRLKALFGVALEESYLMKRIVASNERGQYHGNAFLIHALKNYQLTCPLTKLDRYVCWQSSTQALISRSHWYDTALPLLIEATSILDVGCGLGWDIGPRAQWEKEGFAYYGLDHDREAIRYAQATFPHVRFVQGNVFQLPDLPHVDHLVSLGLFDYFHDKLWVKVANTLKRLLHTDRPSRMILGNFDVNLDSRSAMDMLGWHLYYRSKQDLLNLSQQVHGCTNRYVLTEPLGINHFLVMDFV